MLISEGHVSSKIEIVFFVADEVIFKETCFVEIFLWPLSAIAILMFNVLF